MNEDNIQIMQEMKFQNGRAEGALEEKKRLAKAMADDSEPIERIIRDTQDFLQRRLRRCNNSALNVV